MQAIASTVAVTPGMVCFVICTLGVSDVCMLVAGVCTVGDEKRTYIDDH